MIELAVERLERLAAGYADGYWGAPLAPAGPALDIAALESLVAPWRVPEEVLRIWRFRTGGPITDVLCGIEIDGPLACASNYSMLDEEPFRHPRALLPLGYGHQQRLSVELETGDAPGGALWLLQNDDAGMWEIYPSLRFAFEFAVAAIERLGRRPQIGEVLELHLGGPPFARVGLDRFEPLAWPEHWRRRQGLA